MIYLYLKTHNKTGLKYLGKTEQDPFKYKGSGVRWLKHIKKHGYDVTTEILFETEDREELREVGIQYSESWDIINSSNFANIMLESGDGGDTSDSEKFKEFLQTRDISGDKNGMFGRSAVTEGNLKWYNNGLDTIYVTEGTQPADYTRGRLLGKRKSHSKLTRTLIGSANSKACMSPKGEIFESRKAAAAAYGVSAPAIGGLIKRGKSGWKFIDQ
jgi:hypothetical protein